MTTNIITATLVSESKRMDTADKHFGIRFPISVEPMIFQFASQLAPAYTGGYWNFYQLSNGGFYMAPNLEEPFAVIADNGYEGTLSADALGIPACLYTYSNLSFGDGSCGEKCGRHYHWLFEFAVLHPEIGGEQLIVRATSRVNDVEQILAIPLKFAGGVKPILLSEVATVSIGSAFRPEPRRMTAGKPSSEPPSC